MNEYVFKEKKIFSRRLAVYLRQKGFKIFRTETNIYKPQFDVYIFRESDYLEQAITEYLNSK